MYGTGVSQEVGNGGQVCGDVEPIGFPEQNIYKRRMVMRMQPLNL